MSAAGGRSTGAWAVLALALAVPALLFYGWWSRMDAAKKKELNRKIRDRGVGAFSTSGRNKDKLANPITEDGSAPPAAVPVSTDTVAAAPAQPAPSPADAGPQQPEAAAPVEPAPPPADPAQPPAQAVPGQPGEAAAVAGSSLTARYFLSSAGMPSRDPMLSPYELIQIQREELERRLNDSAIKDEIAPRRPRKPREVMPEVDLQGIISTAEGGFQAIVNDNLVRQGDSVAGGKVKVLKISASAVIFSWKKKRFSRSVND